MSLLDQLGLKPLPTLRAARPMPAPPVAVAAFAAPQGEPPELRSLTLRPGDMTIDGEQTLQFSAEAIDTIGDPVDLSFDVEWRSSSPTVVAIDANGVARPFPVSGRATITATHAASGLSASSVLTVTHKQRAGPRLPPRPKAPPTLGSIVIGPKKPRVVLNSWEQLSATSVFDDGSGQDETQAVEWESSDPDIVSVDAKGRVHGLRIGRAPVGATERNSMLNDWVTVEVVAAELTGLTIDPLNPSLHAAQLLQFRVVAEFSDGVSRSVENEVSWESSAPDVVRIDASGMGIGRNPGNARLTATYRSTDAKGAAVYRQAFAHAHVPTLKALAIEPAESSMLVGEERRFVATGVYTDRSRKEVAGVRWRSGDLGVVSVDKSGRATGRGAGSAVVTAMLEDNPAVIATAKVAVQAAAIREVTIEMMNASAFDGRLQRGQRLQLRARGHAPVGSGKVESRHLADAVWSSTDTKVAQVKDGIVRALAAGDTVIAVADKASGITARIPLKVVPEAAAGSGLPEDLDKLPPALSGPYLEAKRRHDELHAQLRTLDHVPRLTASLEDIVADLGRAGDRAVDKAEKLETQNQLYETVELQIKAFEDHVESARGHLERADAALEVHQGRAEVAALRRQAKEQGKNIKAVMGLLKGAWKVYKQDYVGAALEVVSGALDKFVTSDYDKAADALEKTLDEKTRKLLQADIDAVRRELKLAHEAKEKTKELAARADRFAGNLREKAEEAFDAGAKKGSFRFADITAALTIADRVVDVLVPALKQQAGASAAAVEKVLPRAPRGSEAGLLLREMHSSALGWYADAVTAARQVGAQRDQLRELRRKALTALAFTKPAAKKGAGRAR